MKKILQAMVSELEDLRANQVVITAHVGTGVSSADAQAAKILAKQAVQKEFVSLREMIDALP